MNAEPLHWEATGSGTPVVFAHGFGGSARNFGPQVRALQSRYRVGVFDARGHARSPSEDDPRLYTLAGFVEDWHSVLDGMGVARGVLGGLSMGAATAAHFALAEPERVRALVLASFPLGDAESLAWAACFAAELERSAPVEALTAVADLPGSPIREGELSLVTAGFVGHSAHALRHTLHGLLAAQSPAAKVARAVAELGVPVLVVAGQWDEQAMLAADEFAERCPRAEIVRIVGAGHVVNLVRPVQFNEALLQFLERHHLDART